jgi:cyclophilin family peptidyl-prolyl cis-trans isomerase/HEAT repeat protein
MRSVAAAICLAAMPAWAGATPAAPARAERPAAEARVRPARAAQPEAPAPDEIRRRILEAEDARADGEALSPVFAALESRDNETRRIAVRALGRLERGSLAAAIAAAVSDPAPSVRAEAANALAQAVAVGGGDVGFASEVLLAQLERESHPLVRGALAGALGRLPHPTPEAVRRAERTIASVLGAEPAAAAAARRRRGVPVEATRFASPLVLLGALRGLDALARLHGARVPFEPATAEILRELVVAWRSAAARAEGGPTAEAAARLRRLALSALIGGGAADVETIRIAFGDPDDQVRRLAVIGAAEVGPAGTALLERAVRDPSPMVRAEVLLASRRRNLAAACGLATVSMQDANPHVALAALDAAGASCQGQAAVASAVASAARRLPPAGGPPGGLDTAAGPPKSPASGRAASWHHAAHAIVALARLAPEQALEQLPAFASHALWHVRAYAARAAAAARAADLLEQLAADPHPNVRTEALAGLREVRGHEADARFIEALAAADPQLVLTAARALEGSPRRDEVVVAALAALDRLTAGRRETSRDPRLALLARIGELGGAAASDRLEPYLSDFDPLVARKAAEILTAWKGEPVTAAPKPLPRLPLPAPDQIDALGRIRAIVTLAGGASFELKMNPAEAPLNAWRFVRLAREGYYNGLTFHRVATNFVIQGGSPGANEYAGDGPYTRDEVGLASNLRGTVGLSTRGRDTGDAQFYINLVDNVRLDHTYTVFATVERGMEIVDLVLEGDVIERIEIR